MSIDVDSKWITPKGGTKYIIESDKDISKCLCSICSEDIELFGIFTVPTKNIHRKVWCGCSKLIYWKQHQYEILLRRHAYNIGAILIDLEKPIHSGSKLILRCKVSGLIYNTSYYNFMSSKLTKPLTNIFRNSLNLQDVINSHIKSHQNSTFLYVGHLELRNTVPSQKYLLHTCKVCEGLHKIAQKRFMDGHLGCDCTKKNKSKIYYERLLNHRGRDFKVVYKESTCNAYRVVWSCDNGHENDTALHDLLGYDSGGGCNFCRRQESRLFGFYKNMLNRKDNLYLCTIKSDDEFFIKVGRSFNPKKRLSKLKRDLPVNYNIEMIILDTGIHGDIFRKETEFKSAFKKYKVTPTIKFGGYTECYNIDILEKLK